MKVCRSHLIAIYSRYIYTQMLIAVFSENCRVYQTQEVGSIVVSLHWGILRGVGGRCTCHESDDLTIPSWELSQSAPEVIWHLLRHPISSIHCRLHQIFHIAHCPHLTLSSSLLHIVHHPHQILSLLIKYYPLIAPHTHILMLLFSLSNIPHSTTPHHSYSAI